MNKTFSNIVRLIGFFDVLQGIAGIIFFKTLFRVLYGIHPYRKETHGALLLNHILLYATTAILGAGLVASSKKTTQGALLIKTVAYIKMYIALTWMVSIFKDQYSLWFFVPIVIYLLCATWFLFNFKKLNGCQ